MLTKSIRVRIIPPFYPQYTLLDDVFEQVPFAVTDSPSNDKISFFVQTETKKKEIGKLPERFDCNASF